MLASIKMTGEFLKDIRNALAGCSMGPEEELSSPEALPGFRGDEDRYRLVSVKLLEITGTTKTARGVLWQEPHQSQSARLILDNNHFACALQLIPPLRGIAAPAIISLLQVLDFDQPAVGATCFASLGAIEVISNWLINHPELFEASPKEKKELLEWLAAESGLSTQPTAEDQTSLPLLSSKEISPRIKAIGVNIQDRSSLLEPPCLFVQDDQVEYVIALWREGWGYVKAHPPLRVEDVFVRSSSFVSGS